MKRQELATLIELLKQFGEETQTEQELIIIQKAYELVEDSLNEFNQLVDDSIRDDK